MYKTLKYFFVLVLLMTGGYIALSNSPVLAVSQAVNWTTVIISIIVWLIPLCGIIKNKSWAFYFACFLSGFSIFALIFNGFYNIFDYILLFMNAGILFFIYPLMRLLNKKQ